MKATKYIEIFDTDEMQKYIGRSFLIEERHDCTQDNIRFQSLLINATDTELKFIRVNRVFGDVNEYNISISDFNKGFYLIHLYEMKEDEYTL